MLDVKGTKMKLFKIAVISVSTLVLSACGGSNESPNVNNNDAEAEVVVSDTLPPAPGEDGKLTLSGIDSDDDGVRDDVQIAIYERYGSDEVKVNALEQSAKALQSAIASDTSNIIDASSSVLRAVDCLHETMDDPTAEISFIENSVINTEQRSDAYVTFNDGLNGQFFGDNNTQSQCQ
jgi:uncharacterized lipoprotein YehR (DUF1307 family)